MFVHLIRLLGVTPDDGKSGKREAAWALVFIALCLTIAAMCMGPEMVNAFSPILAILWAAAIGAVTYAYKLEFDKEIWRKSDAPNGSEDFGDYPGEGGE